MDHDDAVQLTIQLSGDSMSERRLNETTVKLKQELSRLKPLTVDRQREPHAPDGTMSVVAFTLGALAVTVLPKAVPAIVEYLRDWSLRNKDHTITIKKRAGTEEIEVSFPQDLSSERLQRLLTVVSDALPEAGDTQHK